MKQENQVIYQEQRPAKQGDYVEFPSSLLEEIKDYLKSQGISKVYSHQAEMFEQAIRNNDVVITTATASGKTLSFLLPVLQELLVNPTSRAIFIYPTKALASDQMKSLAPILQYFDHRLVAGVYDGDTPPNERSRIRKSANLILTNPEMLNGAFMPNHSKYGFDFIFANLKYIVIDEMHTYRGAFGSHMANVFRRLKRICDYYQARPQFLCSSATIANPIELANGICNREFVEVSNDGAPRAARNYVLIQPPQLIGKNKEYYGQVQAATVAAQLLPQLVENQKSFIAFAKSRRNVEVVLKEARDRISADPFLGPKEAEKISGYRGGYTPLERKSIEQKMNSGKLLGLVSTNALELGIDIGQIESTVLMGYPGTKASFWQQTGRAGRSGKESTNYFILDNLPMDQYIGINPKWLFEGGSENAVIDKNNLLIELAHIRAAAAELPLTLDDIALFPDLGETIPVLLSQEELKELQGQFAWCGNSYPAGDFSLRNIDEVQYKLINQINHEEITQMDELQAFHEIHEGAIYIHEGVIYQVLKMDCESHTSYAVPFEGNYYTMPGSHTNILVIHTMKEQEYKRITYSFGDVNVDEVTHMYKRLQFHNHQNLGYERLSKPLSKDFDTESCYIRLPSNIVEVYRRLLSFSKEGTIIHNNHFDGLCHALVLAARMLTMTEQDDLGAVMSSNAINLSQTKEDQVNLYLYDKYVGGLGFSEKCFELLPEILKHSIELVSGCPCTNGCAACVGDYKLDKHMVLWGLKNLLEESEPPENVKIAPKPQETFEKKQFVFEKLPQQWQTFCDYLKLKGEAFAGFLSSVTKVEVIDHRIILTINNGFYKEWILKDTNKKGLINMFTYYTQAPSTIRLEVQVADADQEEQKEVKRKLQRRFKENEDS